MPQVRRTGPYIWSTWLTRLLTGEASCEWASQFKARHESGSWEKAPSDFDQGQWMLRHTALLNDERSVWERGGHAVRTESQNHFTLRGNAAVVAGKPDLIAVKNNVVTIIDVKTGKPSPSHVAQVTLYMYAVPRAVEEYRDMDITGRVAYRDHAVDVPAEAVDEKFRKGLGGADKEAGRGDSSETGSQSTGMQMVRHHRQGLLRANGVGASRQGRNYGRFLTCRVGPGNFRTAEPKCKMICPQVSHPRLSHPNDLPQGDFFSPIHPRRSSGHGGPSTKPGNPSANCPPAGSDTTSGKRGIRCGIRC